MRVTSAFTAVLARGGDRANKEAGNGVSSETTVGSKEKTLRFVKLRCPKTQLT